MYDDYDEAAEEAAYAYDDAARKERVAVLYTLDGALAFLRDSMEWDEEHPEPVEVLSVLHAESDGTRGVTAVVKCADGVRRVAQAWESHSYGSRDEPPMSDGDFEYIIDEDDVVNAIVDAKDSRVAVGVMQKIAHVLFPAG